MCWKAKVASSLADVWQQMFEQQDITVIYIIHFHPWLHKNHTSAPAPANTDWNRYTGSCLSETSECRQWAEAASDWNVVSNQQSYIDQARLICNLNFISKILERLFSLVFCPIFLNLLILTSINPPIDPIVLQRLHYSFFLIAFTVLATMVSRPYSSHSIWAQLSIPSTIPCCSSAWVVVSV